MAVPVRSWWPLLRRQVLLLAILYVGICLFFWWRQEAFIFFPHARQHAATAHVISHAWQRDGIALQAWIRHPERLSAGIMLYCGGNAEDVFTSARVFPDVPMAVVFMEYRGYGRSGGQPEQVQLVADADALLRHLRQHYQPGLVLLAGRSLGSGVVAAVAERQSVDGLILITPFDSLAAVAGDHYPWLPVGMLLRHPFHSARALHGSRLPTVILRARDDRVILPERTRSLRQVLQGPVREQVLDGGHNDVQADPRFDAAIREFVEQVSARHLE